MKHSIPNHYIVWDLETSGLDHFNDKILEIGIIEVKDGQIVQEQSFLLKHPDLKELQEVTVKLTGITMEMIEKDGVEPAIAYDALITHFQKKIPHVTHNGFRFDIPFITAALGLGPNDELTKTITDHMIDTAVVYKAMKLKQQRLVNEPRERYYRRIMDQRVYGLKYNVGVCCDFFGIDRTNIVQHRAGGDIILTNEIYKKLHQ